MAVPTLKSLLYSGFHSGMIWQTVRFWSKEHNAYAYRSLLYAGYTRALVKGLMEAAERGEKGIPNLRKDTVGDLFATIWLTAAQNIECCRSREPKEFFIEYKELYHEADIIPGDAFFEFTMRAFHARNIFKDVHEFDLDRSTGCAMSEAIDIFLNAFSKQYKIMYGIEELENGKVDPARLKEIYAVRKDGLRLRELYLPNALVGGEFQGYGDGKIYIDYEYTPPTNNNSPAIVGSQEDPRSDDEKTHPWRNLAGVISDGDEDDFEEWEEEFLERQEDEEDVTMGNPQEDAEMGGLAGNLELDQEQDQMDLDD